jgi:hypothetical protein
MMETETETEIEAEAEKKTIEIVGVVELGVEVG